MDNLIIISFNLPNTWQGMIFPSFQPQPAHDETNKLPILAGYTETNCKLS